MGDCLRLRVTCFRKMYTGQPATHAPGGNSLAFAMTDEEEGGHEGWLLIVEYCLRTDKVFQSLREVDGMIFPYLSVFVNHEKAPDPLSPKNMRKSFQV